MNLSQSEPPGSPGSPNANQPGNMYVDEDTKLLIKSGGYFVNRGSVFTPDGRIRINFVPIVLNVVLPWILFVFLLSISVFRWRHEHDWLCRTLWDSVVYTTLILLGYRLWRELKSVEPTWARASCFYVTTAICSAGVGAFFIYRVYMEKYYDIMGLKTIPLLDVSTTQGKDVMDAGIFYFSQGTVIDFSRSWHFKHGSTYCVAPLVRKDLGGASIAPVTGNVDFFVVGKDCCSVNSSDYRCPGYDNPKSRAGVRILHGDQLQYYRLAVQQGETQYGYMSNYPIFLEWVQDPVYKMEDLKSQGIAFYFILLFAAFVWQMFVVFLCTVRFSTLGRRKETADGEEV